MDSISPEEESNNGKITENASGDESDSESTLSPLGLALATAARYGFGLSHMLVGEKP